MVSIIIRQQGSKKEEVRMKRKVLALFLTALLVVVMIPMSVSARGWDGNPDSLTYGVITVNRVKPM